MIGSSDHNKTNKASHNVVTIKGDEAEGEEVKTRIKTTFSTNLRGEAAVEGVGTNSGKTMVIDPITIGAAEENTRTVKVAHGETTKGSRSTLTSSKIQTRVFTRRSNNLMSTTHKNNFSILWKEKKVNLILSEAAAAEAKILEAEDVETIGVKIEKEVKGDPISKTKELEVMTPKTKILLVSQKMNNSTDPKTNIR